MPVEMEDPDEPAPRRERFNGGVRRPWWRPAGTLGRIALGLGAFVVLAGIGIGYQETRTFLTRDARFRIEGTGNIQATGLAEVSRAELLPVFGEDIGRNIFFVPLKDRRAQLERIPWVQHATVMRLLPDQIRVEVVEREPVAFVRQGGQIGLVDANGVLLTMPAAMMAQHHYSFPVLTGIDPAEPQDARKKRVDLYMQLMRELDAGGQHFSNQISEIDLTDQEDARVEMQEQGADILAHFGEDHFLERYQRYKAHIGEWRAQYPRLSGVDLRYDQQVVLQMAQGPAPDATAQNAGGAAAANTAPGGNASGAAQQPAKTDTARNDAAQKPAAKPVSAKAPETKAATKPARSTGTKTAKSAETKAKAGAHAKAKARTAKDAAQQGRADRVRKIAMEQRQRAEARRATEKNTKQKSASKPQAPAAAGQGQ